MYIEDYNMENIKINDYDIFYESVKALTKISDGVKMTVNDCGLVVYAKNDYSKCELTSNCITCSNEISFCIGNVTMLLKVLTTIKELYRDGGMESVVLAYDKPFIKVSSKRFKTKIATVDEERIVNFIGNKVHTEMTNQMDFTTSSNLIKSINSHSFIFNDTSVVRVYLETDPDMQNNTVFARIGNDDNDLANAAVLELGMITNGTLDDRKVILDFNRLNILNVIPSEDIQVSLAKERPVLISKTSRKGKNDTFFNLDLYVFLMVK